RRHTRFSRDWSSDVCSSDLISIKKFSIFFSDFVDDINSCIGVNLLIYRCPSNNIAYVFHVSFKPCKRQNDGKLTEKRYVFNKNGKQNQRYHIFFTIIRFRVL